MANKRIRELTLATGAMISGSHYIVIDQGAGPALRARISDITGLTHTAGGIRDPRDDGFLPSASAAVNALALARCIDNAPAGSTLLLRSGEYALNDGFIIEKPLTIKGDGEVVLRFTGGPQTKGNAFWFRSAMDASSASAKVYGPAGGVTYYRTFSGAVAEGARTFTLSNVAGLGPGTECMLLLGVDPNDATQPFLRQWNYVAAVNGTEVSFGLAVPEAINGTSHKCVTFTDVVENCGIEGITIATDGTFSMEVAVWFDKCRNVYARNLNLSGLPRGIVVEGSDNVAVENIFAVTISQYFLFNAFGVTNLYARNLSVGDSTNTAVFLESQVRGAVLENVNIGRGYNATANAPSVHVVGGARGVVLRNFHITHTVACLALNYAEGAEVRTEDWYLYNSEYHRSFPLSQHTGLLYHNEKLYRRIRRWTGRFPLWRNGSYTHTLPSGIYKDVRVITTDTAHLVGININTLGGDILPLLTANTLVRPNTANLTTAGRDADYPFNNTEAHSAEVIAAADMPPAQWIQFEIEYYQPASDDSDATSGAQQNHPYLVHAALWNPGELADGASAKLAFAAVGVHVGDPIACGFASIPHNANWQLSVQCTQADTITAVLTNHTGAPVDLPEGWLRCVIWQVAG